MRKKSIKVLIICFAIIFFVVLIFLLAICPKTPVEKNRLQYTLKSDGTYAVSGIPCRTNLFGRPIYEFHEERFPNVRIPATYKGIAVTEISDYAFNGRDGWDFLKNIEIPSTVTRIGKGAFYGCKQLQSISLPKGVSEIYNLTFRNCSELKKIAVLNSSVNIDPQAFLGVRNISYFEFKNGGKYIFKDGALIDSSTKTLVYLNKSYDIPNDGSVEKLGDYLFWERGDLEEVVIPESVSAIGSNAFRGCSSLRSIVFSGDIYELGESCFEDCDRLEQINIEDLKVKEIREFTFDDCQALNDVKLPENIERICGFAFGGTGIQEISFPESVIEIGRYAFAGCKQLKKVQLNNGISRIEEGAFAYCKKLTMISIPDNITYFGKDVFAEASVSYYVDNNIKYLGNRGNNYLILVGAINTGLTEYEINSSTKIICDQAFSGCTELKEILIPKSVVYIGPEAFDKNVKIIRETEEPT